MPHLSPQQQRAAHNVRRPQYQLSLRAKALSETLVRRSRELHNDLVELLGLARARRHRREGLVVLAAGRLDLRPGGEIGGAHELERDVHVQRAAASDDRSLNDRQILGARRDDHIGTTNRNLVVARLNRSDREPAVVVANSDFVNL